ncbi:MAG: RICIN domain-containing protein [Terracidiphilus sp.]
MNFPPLRTASRVFQFADAPGATSTAHAQSFNKSLTIKSMSKRLFSLGLLFFALGGLTASKTANAQLFTFHNLATGFCLAPQNGSSSAGTDLIVWACNGQINQTWFLAGPTSLGVLPAANLLLNNQETCNGCFSVAGVQGGNMKDGTPVILWTEDPPNNGPTNNQGWELIFIENDQNNQPCFAIANAGTTSGAPFVLGVAGGSTVEGAQVVVWQNAVGSLTLGTIAANQAWCAYVAQ